MYIKPLEQPSIVAPKRATLATHTQKETIKEVEDAYVVDSVEIGKDGKGGGGNQTREELERRRKNNEQTNKLPVNILA